MPGVLLHELTLWLVAGMLNARAEGALQFPDEQDISVLRLSFIRLAPDIGAFKQILMSLSPLASGLAALWAISVPLYPGGEPMSLALPSSVTEMGAAIASLLQTANFWLWLYIVFTIANRCYPTLPMRLSARWKIMLMLAGLALCFGVWRASDAANPAIASGVEGLLNGLTLIIAQITLLNIGCVLALGAIEAVIERISSRSASFRDGRMITHDGSDDTHWQAGQRQGRPTATNPPAARPAKPAMSIYDLKLPIPGPPGREPVSRQAVAVVNLDPVSTAGKPASQAIAERPQPIPTVLDERDESAKDKPNLTSDEAASGARPAAADHDAVAPFARPFAEREASGSASDSRHEARDESDGEPFARPFAMSTRSDQLASAADALEAEPDRASFDAIDSDAANANEEATSGPDDARRRLSHTRPAPKPSQKPERDISSAEAQESQELVYEDLDEIDAYEHDDGLTTTSRSLRPVPRFDQPLRNQ